MLISFVKPLVYLSLPALIIRTVSNSSPTGRYYVRVGLYIGTLTVVAAWGVVVAAALSVVGRRFDVNYVVARSFYAIASRVLDIKVEVEGEDYMETRPAVYMSNHQSMVDVLMLGRIFPMQASIMSKKEMQWTPLGGFMAMSGTVFVDRGNNAKAVQSLAAAGDAMKQRKTSLWMYPEGTRHSQREPSMLKLKKGGFHLAVQAGIPIVPVVTENYWNLYHKGIFNPGIIKMKVLPPIPTSGLSAEDVNDLATRVRNQMIEVLVEISAKVPSEKQEAKESQFSPLLTPTDPVPPTVVSRGEITTTTLVPGGVETGGETESSTGSETSNLRREGSENGMETEEDEGMVLVGRPA